MTILTRDDFRDDKDLARCPRQRIERNLPTLPDSIPIARRYAFEKLKTIPAEWPRERLNLVLGSHDSAIRFSRINLYRCRYLISVLLLQK